MGRPGPVLLLLVLTAVVAGGAGRVADTDEETPLEKAIIYLAAHPELLQDLAAKDVSPGLAGEGPNRASQELLQYREEQYDALCTGCLTSISFIKSLIFLGVKWEDIRDEVVSVCEVVVTVEYERGDILCPGIIDNFGPLVYDILKKTKKNNKKICVHMNWCDPMEMRHSHLKHIHKRHTDDHLDQSPDLAAIMKSLALKELQKKILNIMDESGIDVNHNITQNAPSDGYDKQIIKDKVIPSKGNTDGVPADREPIQKKLIDTDLEGVDDILDDLDLDKLDFPGKISQILEVVSHPEEWKKKLPLEKILKESEKLEKKLNEVMGNLKLKDDLEPNARRMAIIIADAITRATPGRSRRMLRSRKRKALKVAHLTDIHVNEDYLTGAATDCGLPTCCLGDIPGEGKAGHWGTFTCNVPPRTTIQLLQSAASQKPDFVIYSGDNPPHAVWLETLETQLNASRWAAEEISKAFYGTKVFPNMGNHENFPTNMYHAPREETQALNKEWAEMFKEIAGFNSEQFKTIEKSGYYTILARPGLRIVAYNSNYGGTGNFYNILNYDRPEFVEMINWLENTLAAARNASERVIITSHHQYGASENVVAFDEKITRILAKYGDIIVWHPVGHVHRDEFRLNFDPVSGDPVGVVIVAMTMNTLPFVNPGYRMYYLDEETYTLLDYEQYFLDVEKANESPNAPYPIVKLYSAADAYDMLDLTPSSFLALYKRLMSNDKLLQQYWHHFRRAGTEKDGPCDSACKSSQKCHIVSSTYDIYRECMRNQGPNITQTVKGLSPSAFAKNAGQFNHGFGKSSHLSMHSGTCKVTMNNALAVVVVLVVSFTRTMRI